LNEKERAAVLNENDRMVGGSDERARLDDARAAEYHAEQALRSQMESWAHGASTPAMREATASISMIQNTLAGRWSPGSLPEHWT
jgi:hypothetical protein